MSKDIRRDQKSRKTDDRKENIHLERTEKEIERKTISVGRGG